ncbi:MAG: S1/P1 nuclease [Proteobacteria bacterium]|nr:S1/P1 nuclease [Pseudomonadota bacterium]
MRIFDGLSKFLLVLSIAWAAHGSVWAWGSAGHMAVGHLADQLIPDNSHAKAQINAILGANGTLRDAAIWPDCAKYIQPKQGFIYKPDPKYYDKSCTIYDATEEGKTEMRDYVRRNNDNCEYSGERSNCHKSFHFADIPIQENHYDPKFVGAQNYDVVHAINAMIAVLQGHPAPAPFNIPNNAQGKREALRLLTHFVGDIHQPLHVGSVYLKPNGQMVDPDKTGYDPQTNTVGGNSLVYGSNDANELHGEWDHVSTALAGADLVSNAEKVGATSGPLQGWIEIWATESVQQARKAYEGINFGPSHPGNHANSLVWPVTFKVRKDYLTSEHEMQREQVIKAGRRLAQVLQVIWP